MSSIQPVVDFGKDPTRLLANRIDLLAKVQPHRIFASVPRSARPREGFQDVTYGEFAGAVNRAAWWLDGRLRSTTQVKSFAYLGPRDLRYPVLLVAAIKSGRWMLVLSPILPGERKLEVLDAVGCHTLLVANITDAKSQFEELGACRPGLESFAVPELSDWFAKGEGEDAPYIYEKTWAAAINEPAVAFHTSGTTGPPKPVIFRNSTIVYFDAQRKLGESGQPIVMNSWIGRRILHSFSVQHMGGILFSLIYPVYFDSIGVMTPSTGPISTEIVDEAIRYGDVSGVAVSPFHLEDLARSPGTLKTLQGLDSIGFGSAPLDKATGDLLSKHAKLEPVYGSTEMTFTVSYEHADLDDYAYFHFHPYMGFEFIERNGGLYELIVVRREDLAEFQPVFANFPELSQFKTKDLFSPHPTKPNLWSYRGRTDDMIILSDGECLHVNGVEQAIQEHPLVKTALIGGKGRTRTFLLLELADNAKADAYDGGAAEPDTIPAGYASSLDTLWPVIEKANGAARHEPLYLSKSFTIVAPEDKPFARTLKGSLDRSRTLALYKTGIEQLYKKSSDA